MSGLIDMWITEVAKFKDKGMSYFHLDKSESQQPSKSQRATTEGHDGGEGGALHNQYHQQQLQERYPVLSQVLRIKASTSTAPLISDEALHMVFDCSSP